MRSERALKLALAEMYGAGVSTRKIAHVTQQLFGFEVSTSEVSGARPSGMAKSRLGADAQSRLLPCGNHLATVRCYG